MRLFLLLVLTALLQGPAYAQVQAIDAPPGDRAYVATITATIPGYDRMQPIQKVQALRAYAYKTVPLASVQDFLVHEKVVNLPLRQAYEVMDQENGGVWCSGAAILLSRIYEAAGFDSWIYSFGKENALTHTTTLVRADGKVYLQDSYLNFEYVDETERPIPFLDVIEKINNRKPPAILARAELKKAFFLDDDILRAWTGKHYYRSSCAPVGMSLECTAVVTLDRFLETFFLIDETYDFLESEGLPRQVDYLMLYPISLVTNGGAFNDEAKHLLAEVTAAANG